MNAASAGKRAQGTCIAVEFLRGNFGANDLKLALDVHAENSAAPAREIAHDFAHAILGNPHFDHIDRFEQTGPCFYERFLKRPIARDLECDVVRVHGVHFSVVKIRLDIHDAIAGENSLRARDPDAALDRRHEHAIHALA